MIMVCEAGNDNDYVDGNKLVTFFFFFMIMVCEDHDNDDDGGDLENLCLAVQSLVRSSC